MAHYQRRIVSNGEHGLAGFHNWRLSQPSDCKMPRDGQMRMADEYRRRHDG